MDLSNLSRCWNKSFHDFMVNLGLKQSAADPCVFILSESITIVAVYVDDLDVMSTSTDKLNAVKEALSGRFKMKDMGPLHYCLGVQNAGGIWLHQKEYILSLLQKFGLMDAKPATTQANSNVRLMKDDGVSR